jgi:hypothetical protein
MEAEKDGMPPDFKPIQPWDLAHPIPVYSETSSKKLPCFYDASTQDYWLFTIEGAALLHKTPKAEEETCGPGSRKVVLAFPVCRDRDPAAAWPPRSQSPLIANRTILENSLHDSVTVLRNSGA